jgi:energy-coupling factor transporter ATP-binding protein EcfA2
MKQKAIITVRDLHFAYPSLEPRDEVEWVLNGLDLEVEAGSITAIMGPSGAGKTTLALALLGIVPQSTGGRIRGSIQVAGKNPIQTPVAEMARSVGLVFQDAESQFLTQSAAEEIAFGLESLGINPELMEARIRQALAQVGLSGYADRSPYELSGGQKQRVALASILAMQPQVLILDEAAASLDPQGKSEIKQVLADLRQAQVSIVLITNQAEWVFELADQIIILDQGRVRHHGTPVDIFHRVDELISLGLRPPELLWLRHSLQSASQHAFQFDTWNQAEQELSRLLPGQAT